MTNVDAIGKIGFQSIRNFYETRCYDIREPKSLSLLMKADNPGRYVVRVDELLEFFAALGIDKEAGK